MTVADTVEQTRNARVVSPDFYDALTLSGYAIGQVALPRQHVAAFKSFAARASQAKGVAVIGYTDRHGSIAANQALASARAARLTQTLIKHSVSVSVVRVFECTHCYDANDDSESRRVSILLSDEPITSMTRERVIAFEAVSRAPRYAYESLSKSPGVSLVVGGDR
jgi:hypothetical protein